MEQLTAKIDVNTSRGRKLVRELHGQKCVEIENPIPAEMAGKIMYSVEEAYSMMMDLVNEHYGKEPDA